MIEVNAYSGSLAEFIRCWDARVAMPAGRAEMRHSPAGNINRHGSCDDYTAECLTSAHPQFAEGLEPAVAQLVLHLVRGWGLITYSSCAGHLYQPQRLPPTPRYVGILPRNGDEQRRISDALAGPVEASHGRFPASAVLVATRGRPLVGDDGPWPVIELLFGLRPSASWWTYFDEIEQVYQAFLEDLPRGLEP